MKVTVRIKAEVTTTLEVDSLEEVDARWIDIYSFKDGQEHNKEDHGADNWTIKVLDNPEKTV